jgi:hypothetical protein
MQQSLEDNASDPVAPDASMLNDSADLHIDGVRPLDQDITIGQ